MRPLKQYLPQNICLECRGCCRFQDSQSIWRPKVFPEELAFGDIPTEAVAEGYLKVEGSSRSSFQCQFLDKKNNTCRIYSTRPYECQLYPFLLIKKNKNIVLSVHLSCPFVLVNRYKASFEDYVNYLKDYFSGQEVKAFLRKNQDFLEGYADYYDEIEDLFDIILE